MPHLLCDFSSFLISLLQTTLNDNRTNLGTTSSLMCADQTVTAPSESQAMTFHNKTSSMYAVVTRLNGIIVSLAKN